MPNLPQQLADFGIVNNQVLEEAKHLPGFAEILAGNQLSFEQECVFRKGVARTIAKYRDKKAASIQLTKLYTPKKIKQWIHSFAPFAKHITFALQPIIKLICYQMNWPYVEVWSSHDIPGSRALRVDKSFIYTCKRWFLADRPLQKLADYMHSYTITLPSRELPGEVFTSSKTKWGSPRFRISRDAKRRKLLSRASLEHSFSVPLRGDAPPNVTHALVFYAPVDGPRSRFARNFLFPAAQDAVNAYKSVEEIHPDENEALDETKARQGRMQTMYGEIQPANIVDGLPEVQRSRSLTSASNSLCEKP